MGKPEFLIPTKSVWTHVGDGQWEARCTSCNPPTTVQLPGEWSDDLAERLCDDVGCLYCGSKRNQ